MKNYIIFDTHCDTAEKILSKTNKRIEASPDMMNHYHHFAQFFASFISDRYYENPLIRTLELINTIYNLAGKYDMNICTDIYDLKKSWKKNKTAAFISVEDACAVKNIEILEILYSLGVRMMSLTHNNTNHLGGGALGEGGLSDLGKSVVLKMNELGMILDVSHSNEKTFFDICKSTNFPIVASHSNSYTICKNPRNLKDSQFEEIRRLGGVCGICYYPPFLSEKEVATIDDIILHIEYFLSLGGEDNICLGSDFDGVDYLPDGLNNVDEVYKILNLLAKKGVSNDIIEKIAYKNIMRVLCICL